MKCRACSAAILDDARYCSSCGEAISSVSEALTSLASPSAAALRRSPSSVPVGRLASCDSIEGGTFEAGTVLLERYRIIGLLDGATLNELRTTLGEFEAAAAVLGRPLLSFRDRSDDVSAVTLGYRRLKKRQS